MAHAAATTSIEVETGLVERLRARDPGKSDRELIEDMAWIDLGFALLRQAQLRNSLTEGSATELGVRAVDEVRQTLR